MVITGISHLAHVHGESDWFKEDYVLWYSTWIAAVSSVTPLPVASGVI